MACSSTSAHLKLTLALLFTLTSWSASAVIKWDFSAIFEEPEQTGYLCFMMFLVSPNFNPNSEELPHVIPLDAPTFVLPTDHLMYYSRFENYNRRINHQIMRAQDNIDRYLTTQITQAPSLGELINSRVRCQYVITLFSNQHVIMIMYPYATLRHRCNSQNTFNHQFRISSRRMPVLDIFRDGEFRTARDRLPARGFNSMFPASVSARELMEHYRTPREYQHAAANLYRNVIEILRADRSPSYDVRRFMDVIRRFRTYIRAIQAANLDDPTSHRMWIARSQYVYDDFLEILKINWVSFYIFGWLNLNDNEGHFLPVMFYNGPLHGRFDCYLDRWYPQDPDEWYPRDTDEWYPERRDADRWFRQP